MFCYGLKIVPGIKQTPKDNVVILFFIFMFSLLQAIPICLQKSKTVNLLLRFFMSIQ